MSKVYIKPIVQKIRIKTTYLYDINNADFLHYSNPSGPLLGACQPACGSSGFTCIHFPESSNQCEML